MFHNMIGVYLAGGFHNNWQETVERACAGLPFFFVNPKRGWHEEGLSLEEKQQLDKACQQSVWWHWDRLAIRLCEVVFVNCEDYKSEDGYRGIGDILEVGLAWSQDKLVIFVNQVDHRYFNGVARNFLTYRTLEEGINALKAGAWILNGEDV